GVTRQAPGSGECPGARHRGGRGPGAPGLPSGRLANPTPPPRPPPNTRLLLPPPHPLQSAAIIESVKFLYTAAQQKRRSLGGEPHSPDQFRSLANNRTAGGGLRAPRRPAPAAALRRLSGPARASPGSPPRP